MYTTSISILKSGWVFKNPQRFEQAVQSAVKKTTPQLPKLPKARSRVRTGRMFASWQSENLGNSIRVASVGISYSIFHEVGTRYMSAQPMLAPSIPEMVKLLSNNIVTEIGDL